MLHLYQDKPIGGADILNSLADVNINNPENKQIIYYDQATGTWRNYDPPFVNSENVLHTVEECAASTNPEDVAGASVASSLNSALTDANCKIGAEIVSPVTWNKEGWTPLNNIDNIVTPPALSGYSCIGFIIKQTSTYRIIAPYVYYSSGSWNIAFYAVNTSATSGTISMYPIYRKI